MLTADVSPDISPSELADRYRGALRDSLAGTDLSSASERTGLPVERLEAVTAGGAPDQPLTLAEAAAIVSLSDDSTTQDDVLGEVRDVLLLEMSTAVVDVDTVTRELEGPTDAATIQRKIEGRESMTLDEYAAIRLAIAKNGVR